jgi:hypothetical protein
MNKYTKGDVTGVVNPLSVYNTVPFCGTPPSPNGPTE